MIPKLLHFVHDTPGLAFSFTDYVAIKSAARLHPDFEVHFHCSSLPDGHYWDVARQYVHHIHQGQVATGRGVHGLAQLNAIGGVLLGLDTITLLTFDDLLDNHLVLGSSAATEGPPMVGNAVVLAMPGTKSLGRLQHLTQVGEPLLIERLCVDLPSDRVLLLPAEAFHSATDDAGGLRDLLIEDKAFPGARVLSLWFPRSLPMASKLDERNVSLIDSTYGRLARQVIDADAARFAQARRQELAAKCTPPIRVNLGCGANKRTGWLNVDSEPAASPDLIFDISASPWPLPDNSIGEVELSHVLEHVGDRFEIVMKELYRTCMHGATIKVAVPHPRHDWYLADPTHSRPLVPLSFQLLDAEWCKNGLLAGQTATPLAVYWKVDFELVSSALEPSPDFLRLPSRRLLWLLGYPFALEWNERATRLAKHLLGRKLEATDFAQRRLTFLARHLNNMVGQLRIELRVRKDSTS